MALALAIPKSVEHREVILVATYVVVIFSIAVQGLTLKPLVAKLVRDEVEEKNKENEEASSLAGSS